MLGCSLAFIAAILFPEAERDESSANTEIERERETDTDRQTDGMINICLKRVEGKWQRENVVFFPPFEKQRSIVRQCDGSVGKKY